MYGSDNATVTALTTGTASTVAGIAVLPYTGGNTLLAILSIVGITAGALVVGSFVVARIATIVYRSK
jgi:hypothetical protein